MSARLPPCSDCIKGKAGVNKPQRPHACPLARSRPHGPGCTPLAARSRTRQTNRNPHIARNEPRPPFPHSPCPALTTCKTALSSRSRRTHHTNLHALRRGVGPAKAVGRIQDEASRAHGQPTRSSFFDSSLLWWSKEPFLRLFWTLSGAHETHGTATYSIPLLHYNSLERHFERTRPNPRLPHRLGHRSRTLEPTCYKTHTCIET